MTEESFNPNQNEDEPQVYAVNKGAQGWQFNRRDFLKAAGVAGAAGAIGSATSPAHAQAGDGTALTPADPPPLGTRAHRLGVTSIALSGDGTLLVSASSDQTFKLWTLPDAALIRTLDRHLGSVTAVAISEDGTLLASGGDFMDRTIRLWSLPDADYRRTLRSGPAQAIKISPDGTLLVVADADHAIQLRSLPTGELLNTLEGHRDLIYSLAISPDGRLLASGARDNTVKLWSLPDGELLQTLEGHTDGIKAVAISADGRLLASGSEDATIRLWTLPEGTLLRTINNQYNLESLAISPDSSLLAVASWDRTVKLWSLPDGILGNTLQGHSDVVSSVAISADGTLLASGSWNGTLKLWSLPDGVYLREFIDIAASGPEFEGVQYSPHDEGASVITLPCGSPIPAGSTCICNCVTGSSCSCVGFSGGSGHYWYPN